MISVYKKRRLAFITIVYWFLLLFIMAAWVWWFISLQNQNDQMRMYKLLQLNKDDTAYEQNLDLINEEYSRKTAQWISEGITFVLVTMIGAVFVYRSVRKQFLLGKQQQNFMMAITHELKTPIAVTKLNLETLQKRTLNDEQRQKLISTTIQEANRLNALCNNMLLTSQIELGGYNIIKESIDFARLVNECAHDFIIRFPLRKIETLLPVEAYISGDLLLLTLAVNNLLDNAIKYSGKEDIVLLTMLQTSKETKLQVIDEGPGIPPGDREKIFEKYYRGNMRQKKGTGIGLYLTRKIVQEHHGTIRMKDNFPHGSIFEISLVKETN